MPSILLWEESRQSLASFIMIPGPEDQSLLRLMVSWYLTDKLSLGQQLLVVPLAIPRPPCETHYQAGRLFAVSAVTQHPCSPSLPLHVILCSLNSSFGLSAAVWGICQTRRLLFLRDRKPGFKTISFPNHTVPHDASHHHHRNNRLGFQHIGSPGFLRR